MEGMGILEVFGLQVLLEDKTSENARNVSESLKRMGVVVEDVERSVYGSFQRMESVMHSGFQIHLWGQRIVGLGQGIANIFKQTSLGVLKTSGDFETLRTRLNVLYNDAKKGEEMFQWGVQGALKTPFSVKEYVDAIANFKGVNIDPQWQFKNERQNKMQDLIAFAGDLAAGTGKKINDAYFSMKEAIAGNDWVSLKRRFDGITKDMVESVTGMVVPTGGAMNDIQKRAEILAKYIGMRFGGMTDELGKTLTGLTSRAKENLQILLMMIGDAGFFKKVKTEMEKLISFIESNQERLKKFAQVVSDSLSYLVTPIAKLVDLAQRLSLWFADFSVAHPILARTIMSVSLLTSGLLTFSGILVMVGGSLITMIASLATLALNMKFSHGSTKLSSMIFQGFGKIILGLTWNLMKLAGFTSVFSMMWTHNMGGIQDSFFGTIEVIKEANDRFRRFLSMDLSTFVMMVDRIQKVDRTANKLALTFMKGYYVLAGFFDYLNDGAVSKDTVMRLQALGALGWLETLIKIETTIRSIFEGVGQSFTGIWKTLKPPFEWLYNRLLDIASLVDKIFGTSTSSILTNEVSNVAGKQSYSSWQAVGKIIGGAIVSVMGMKLATSMSAPIVRLMKLNEMFKKAIIASKGIYVDDNKMMTKRFTFDRYEKVPYSGTPKLTGKHKIPTTKDVVGAPITWRNIFMELIGSKYARGRKYLYDSDSMGNETGKWVPHLEKYNDKKREGLDILERETALLKNRNKLANNANKSPKKMNKLFNPLSLLLFGINDKMGGMGRVMDVVGKKLRGQKLSSKMTKGVSGSDAYVWKQLKDRLNPTNWMRMAYIKGGDKLSPNPNKKLITERIIEKIVTTKDNAKTKVLNWMDTIKGIGKGFVGFILGALSSTKIGAMLVSRIAPIIALAIANPLATALIGVGALVVGVLSDSKLATTIYKGFWTGIEWLIAGIYVASKGLIYGMYKLFTGLNNAFVTMLQATGTLLSDVIDKVLSGDFTTLISDDYWSKLGKNFKDNLGKGLNSLVDPLFDLNAGISDKIYQLNNMVGMGDVDWGETGWKNYAVQHENNKVMQPLVTVPDSKSTKIESNLSGMSFALEKQGKITEDVTKLTEQFVSQSKQWTSSLKDAYLTGNLSTEDLTKFYQVYTDSVNSTLAQLKLAYERGQITAEDRSKIESLITQHQAVKKQMVDSLATGLSHLQQMISPELEQFSNRLKGEIQKFVSFTPVSFRTPIPTPKQTTPSMSQPTPVSTPRQSFTSTPNLNFNPNGRHKSGLDRVPYDGYIAELHAGETVLRKEDADLFRRYGLAGTQEIHSGSVYDRTANISNSLVTNVAHNKNIVQKPITSVTTPFIPKYTQLTNMIEPNTEPTVPTVVKVQPSISKSFDNSKLEDVKSTNRNLTTSQSTNTQKSSTVENHFYLENIEFSLPNITDSSNANDLIQQLKDNPSLIKALQGVLQKASKQETFTQRAIPESTWGVRR